MKLTFHTDPGHGWVEIPIKTLVELNIQDKISECSYRRGNTAYLEEDCDAGVLIEALKQMGEGIEIDEKNEPRNYSFVRSLPRYWV